MIKRFFDLYSHWKFSLRVLSTLCLYALAFGLPFSCLFSIESSFQFLSTKSSIDSFFYYKDYFDHDPAPYILPNNHPLKPILDNIFPNVDVIKDAESFARAGFITLRDQKSSGIRIARHPSLKGYVVKLYLQSQKLYRTAMSQQNWLIQRCRGAEKIRQFLTLNHIKHFTVPDKWLYELPSNNQNRTFVVVASFMHLVSKDESRKAWKTKVTEKHLDELLTIMKSGGASPALLINLPYTKEGAFAFVDTEYPDRIFYRDKLIKVQKYLSPEMQKYWETICQKRNAW